jgi:hypothetical protein
MSKAVTNPAQAAFEMQQQNDYARRAVVGNSIKMVQQISSRSIDTASETVINLGAGALRNAGMLLGFIVEVSGTVENTGAATPANDATLTTFGTANIVEQFRFDDLSGYTRIQTSGRHISLLNSVRQGFAYGGAYAPNLPVDYGNNFDVFQGPQTVAGAGGTAALRHVYYLPIAYSPADLRGAIYMATVGAQANLQITLQGNPGANGGNALNKVYSGGTVDWDGPVTVTVYQVYLDQIPRMPDGAPIVPLLDLDTVYDLKETTFTGMTVGQDFPMPYSNYRAFLSTLVVFDNGGTFGTGSDVNYWSLASANFTNLFKVSPKIAALNARMAIMSDLPNGTYLFDSRETPINTINFGNMELNINAATVNANARAIVGYEAFARVGQLKGASSLSGG